MLHAKETWFVQGQQGSTVLPASTARELQETVLKVMCQQFHGAGSLERNFPEHIWKMRMKKKCVSENFGSGELDGSLVGD